MKTLEQFIALLDRLDDLSANGCRMFNCRPKQMIAEHGGQMFSFEYDATVEVTVFFDTGGKIVESCENKLTGVFDTEDEWVRHQLEVTSA